MMGNINIITKNVLKWKNTVGTQLYENMQLYIVSNDIVGTKLKILKYVP